MGASNKNHGPQAPSSTIRSLWHFAGGYTLIGPGEGYEQEKECLKRVLYGNVRPAALTMRLRLNDAFADGVAN
jgi:hypothetical protein